MASKTLVLLGLFAVLLVVSAEVAAASDTVKSESKESVQPEALCRFGCCYVYKYRPGCARCCAYAGETVQTQPGH